MEIKGLDDLLVPADRTVDVKQLLGRTLADIEVAQIITASATQPKAGGTPIRTTAKVEELIDGSDNFI